MDSSGSNSDRKMPGFLQDQGLSRHVANHGSDVGSAQATPNNSEVYGVERAVDDAEAFDEADLADIEGDRTDPEVAQGGDLAEAAFQAIRKNPLVSLGGAFAVGLMLASLSR